MAWMTADVSSNLGFRLGMKLSSDPSSCSTLRGAADLAGVDGSMLDVPSRVPEAAECSDEPPRRPATGASLSWAISATAVNSW